MWLAFALLCASVLVDLAFYLPSHRSASLLILAAGVALAALSGIAAALGVAFRLTPEALVRLRARADEGQSLYLSGALAVAFLLGLGIRPEWIYAHIVLMLGLGLVLGYTLLYADAPAPGRFWIAAGVAVVIVVTLMRVNALSDYPLHDIEDEPWILGWALSYFQHGHFTDTIMYFGGSDIQRFMLPFAWWIGLFGSGYWQARLFFFLLIVPLILLTGRAAHNLYGNGRMTAFVMFSSAVVMSAARIRHDLGLALAVAASLWLYSEASKREKRWLHLCAGLAIGLGWFAHYHAILFGAALALAFYLPRALKRRRPGSEALFFVAGGLLGAGIVFLFQIVPDWEYFLTVRQPRTALNLAQWIEAFFGHWLSIAKHSQFEFLLLLAAIIAALWRRGHMDIVLLLALVLFHIALTVQTTITADYYVLPISPVYGILIAALLSHGFRAPPPDRFLAWAAASLMMIINLGVTLQIPLAHLRAEAPLQLPTPPAAAWIRENIDLSQSIVAEHWYYLFLTDYKFISPATRGYAPISKRLDSAEAMWDQISPDVVMIDRNLSTCCVPQPIYDAEYLQSRGYREIIEMDGERYPIVVYEKDKGA